MLGQLCENQSLNFYLPTDWKINEVEQLRSIDEVEAKTTSTKLFPNSAKTKLYTKIMSNAKLKRLRLPKSKLYLSHMFLFQQVKQRVDFRREKKLSD